MFFTGAQPVGGGVGAGWRERGGGKAVGPVQSSSGRLSLKDRYMFYWVIVAVFLVGSSVLYNIFNNFINCFSRRRRVSGASPSRRIWRWSKTRPPGASPRTAARAASSRVWPCRGRCSCRKAGEGAGCSWGNNFVYNCGSANVGPLFVAGFAFS